MNGRRAAALLLFATTVLAACGDRDDATPDGAGTTDAVDNSTAPGSQDAPPVSTDGSVEVTITDGPGAGTHRMEGETICVHNAGTWITSFSEVGKLETQAVLEGVGANGGTTQQGQYTVVIGDMMDEQNIGTMVILDGSTGELEGTVTMRGESADVEMRGTSHGTRVQARFRCSTVQR